MRTSTLYLCTVFLLAAGCGSEVEAASSTETQEVPAVETAAAATGVASGAVSDGSKTMSRAVLEDKLRGGWAGQMIGVSFGFPTEFRYLARTIPEEELPTWTPDMVSESLRQDDLYVDMTFFAVIDELGINASTTDFGAAFRDTQYPLWHANYAARRALRRGVPAELTGTHAVNPHVNDIDFQIEADFIGLLTPGMPQTAVNLSERVGRVMNDGDGLLGGVFVAGLYSAAFFNDDPKQIVESALALLPPHSDYARIIVDTLTWASHNPDDWLATWQQLQDNYATKDVCPAGAGSDFNIDAHLNGAYIVLGLLYGDSDFEKTMKIATQAGQDSDCNPASAVGVLGVMMGYSNIPEKYKSGIPAIAQEKFLFTNYSYEDIVTRNLAHIEQLVIANGGAVSPAGLNIPIQSPIRAQVNLFGLDRSGHVHKRLSAVDPRVQRHGDWVVLEGTRGGILYQYLSSATAGASVEIDFDGSGIALTAKHEAQGGTVKVWLDGVDQGVFDTFSEETDGTRYNDKWSESLFHRHGLTDEPHTLRVEVLGQPYRRKNPDGREVESLGTNIMLQNVVVYQGGKL